MIKMCIRDRGSVTIDGVDVRDVKQHDLRELIGVVPQKGVLFSGKMCIRDRFKVSSTNYT